MTMWSRQFLFPQSGPASERLDAQGVLHVAMAKHDCCRKKYPFVPVPLEPPIPSRRLRVSLAGALPSRLNSAVRQPVFSPGTVRVASKHLSSSAQGSELSAVSLLHHFLQSSHIFLTWQYYLALWASVCLSQERWPEGGPVRKPPGQKLEPCSSWVPSSKHAVWCVMDSHSGFVA